MFAWVIMLFFASPVSAINLLVSNNNDSGAGSLRQAIQDNDGSGPGDTIIFSNTVTGTITLTTSNLLITTNLTIVGPGPGVLAISGNGARRVLHIANGANVTISGLTIRQGTVSGSFPGNVGGAIWNERSTLTLRNCVIRDNKGGGGEGGAIFNDGSFGTAYCLIEQSTISNNSTMSHGGAIYNYCYQGTGTVFVVSSTISGNSAFGSGSVGGGVFNDGTSGNAAAVFVSSTISGNTAGQSGGGIYNGTGSGISYVALDYSTVSSNSASFGGGILHNGVGGSATLALRSTLLKTGTSGPTIENQLGTVVDYGFNLSSDNGGGVLTQVTDYRNVNPLLGPLADNGGPTFTHALLPGSPAIDKGYNGAFGSELTPDQRGELRPFNFTSITNTPGGNGTDIGSFEVGRPKLDIQKAGSSVVLSWLAYSSEFALQSSTNITSSNSWITAGGSAAIVGNQYQQTNGPISGNKFFRLRGN
ncbi:MAG: choice-of-anchor Q domain-containing protein [Verrucomicrobiota bacterium]